MSDRALVLAIVDRLAIGTASDEDRDQLNAALQRDPGCVEIYARAMRQQRLLRVLLAEGATADEEAAGARAPVQRPERRLPRRRGRGRRMAWAVATSLVAIVAWLAWQPADHALTVVAGDGRAGATALALGDVVTLDTPISTASGGLELRAGDGCRIVLAADTELELRANDERSFEADLMAGSAQFTVPPQVDGRQFAVTTPQAIATVRGTIFTLTVAADVTRLAVSEGRVGFQRRSDGWSVEVSAGEEASTAESPERPPAEGSVWRVNLGGPGLDIDGVAWDGHQEAEQRGLRCSATLRANPKEDPILKPRPDPETRTLLATGVWEMAAEWRLTLPVEPGDYLVRVWVVENHPLNEQRRRFDVVAEGRDLFTGIGTMPLGNWRIHGPARVSVSDGALDLDCIPRQDDAHLMAVEVLPAPR